MGSRRATRGDTDDRDDQRPAHPTRVEHQRIALVIPRIHDGSGTRTRYGQVPVAAAAGARARLAFPCGPVVEDPEQLRAGAALLLARQIGEGMSAAVIAPLGRLRDDDGTFEHHVDVMLAVARRTGSTEASEPVEDHAVVWVDERELLEHLSTGRITDTTTAAAVALLLACGELVR